MRKLIFIIISVLVFNGCKTITDSETEFPVQKLVNQNTDNNVFIRAKIHPDFPDINQSFTANININSLDSMSVQVFGPFGISLGRLFSTEDEFVFFNTFENSIYKGSPSSENLKRIAGLELDFKDLIKILRLNIPSKLSGFKQKKDYNEEGRILFQKFKKYPEYILYSTVSSDILQYQRKDNQNNEKITIIYDKFIDFEIGNRPSKVSINLPQSNGKITIDIKEYKIDNSNDNLSFTYPENIKVVNLDK